MIERMVLWAVEEILGNSGLSGFSGFTILWEIVAGAGLSMSPRAVLMRNYFFLIPIEILFLSAFFLFPALFSFCRSKFSQ